MYPQIRKYMLIINIVLFSTVLFAQNNNWSQFENQKSPYQAYLEVNDNENRKTEVVKQKWNDGASTWENDSKEEYQYTFENTVLGIYSLQYFYAYYFVTGNWVPLYYYYYYYNALGQLSGYDYYGWLAGAWVLFGTGVFSDHNSNGDWATETFTKTDPSSMKESSKTTREFNGDGKITNIFYWRIDEVNNAEPTEWKRYGWAANYVEMVFNYNWNSSTNDWDPTTWEKFRYDNGFGEQAGQSQGYLFEGSPTSRTVDTWDGSVWITSEHEVITIVDGVTTSSRLISEYPENPPASFNPNDHTTWGWEILSYLTSYDYDWALDKVGRQSSVTDLRLKLVDVKTQGDNEGEWINFERTWFSYENYTVSTDGENLIPTSISLEQNYPNPFNPSTIIEFTIDKKSDVVLSIHDITGKVINELTNKKYPVGIHSVKWNGTDSYGKKVSTGIYIYTLKANETISTKKMIMMN